MSGGGPAGALAHRLGFADEGGRWLLVREVLPGAKRIAVVAQPQHPGDGVTVPQAVLLRAHRVIE